MNRPRMSAAASSLLRILLRRSELPADRILLTHWISTDWQSLTFSGERHQAGFRVTGPGAAEAVAQWLDGIEEVDLPLGRCFVAEIGLSAEPAVQNDGSVLVELEALTLED